LRNRSFAARFHTTVVLGLEEELQGTMLEHLSERDCITMGFEAGQHADPRSVATHEAVIEVALVATGILPVDARSELAHHVETLQGRCKRCPAFFEILHRHAITPADAFRMQPGWTNFDAVARHQILGEDARGPVRSTQRGLILMPLYQGLGADGFFVGRPVRRFWLQVSAWVRRLGLERVMPWLPGVQRVPEEPEVLRVDTRVARFYPLQIFHLLGYRRRRREEGALFVSRRREFPSRTRPGTRAVF